MRALEIAKQIAWTIPITVAFTDLVASVIKVEGPSMQPTFNPQIDKPSDWVLVEKFTSKVLYKYNRGDVVVLMAPDDPQLQITKRLIGLEHDVVWDDRNRTPEVIGQGKCWIEGDNSQRSGDSRSLYGPVHLGLIQGRAICVVWPPSRVGLVKSEVPQGKVIMAATGKTS